jgi:hydrogenase maturation protease
MNDTRGDARMKKADIIKIIGVGQSLRGDDAVGLEVVRLWRETYHRECTHPNLQIELIELPGIDLLNVLDGSGLAIIVDATHGSSKPGTVYKLSETDLVSFSGGSRSAHGWGVAETLSLGRQLMPTKMPHKLILIGIEAGQLTLGGTLSSEVQDALPEAARLIDQYIRDEFKPE